MRHAADLAGQLAKNPQRSLVYTAALADVLAEDDLFRRSVFRDHRLRPVPLLAASPK